MPVLVSKEKNACEFNTQLRLFNHPAFNLHIRRRDAGRGTRLRLLPVHDTPEVDRGEKEALTLTLYRHIHHATDDVRGPTIYCQRFRLTR